MRLFAFVGLTEQWDASICLRHESFGGTVHDFEYVNVRKGSYSEDPSSIKDVNCGDAAEEQLYACTSELSKNGAVPQV